MSMPPCCTCPFELKSLVNPTPYSMQPNACSYMPYACMPMPMLVIYYAPSPVPCLPTPPSRVHHIHLLALVVPPLPPPTFPHLLLLLFILFYFLCYCWRGILGMWPFYFEFIFCFLSKNGREWMTSTLPPPPCYFVEHRYVYISNIVFHLLRLNVASI